MKGKYFPVVSTEIGENFCCRLLTWQRAKSARTSCRANLAQSVPIYVSSTMKLWSFRLASDENVEIERQCELKSSPRPRIHARHFKSIMPGAGISALILRARAHTMSMRLAVLPSAAECATVLEVKSTATDLCSLLGTGLLLLWWQRVLHFMLLFISIFFSVFSACFNFLVVFAIDSLIYEIESKIYYSSFMWTFFAFVVVFPLSPSSAVASPCAFPLSLFTFFSVGFRSHHFA